MTSDEILDWRDRKFSPGFEPMDESEMERRWKETLKIHEALGVPFCRNCGDSLPCPDCPPALSVH
jgi:hypothetical protein